MARVRRRASNLLGSAPPRPEPSSPAHEIRADIASETSPCSSPEPQQKMSRTKFHETKVHRAHVRTTLTKDGLVQRLGPLVLRSAGAGWPIREEWVERLKAAGLLPLARMMEGTPRDFLDRDLLTALVDRWNPGTHTFQFPWGEMGVSLKDVSMLLGLPIKGEPIAKPTASENWAEDMDKRFSEHVPEYVSVKKAKEPVKPKQNKSSEQKLRGPTLSWLRSTFDKLTRLKEPTKEQSQCAVEIYVLWLFGWVMFTSSHGDAVEARLINYAMDIAYSKIEDIKEISYGSAVLAGLYRANCDSCMRTGKKSNYVGCPLLLNLWSYEYLPLGCPEETVFKLEDNVYKDDVDAPTVGSYWTTTSQLFKKAKHVCYDTYSQNIDFLRPCRVNWNPYTQDKLQQRAPGGLSSLCTRDRKFWFTKRNLLYDIFVEEYAPQRFMRQFDLEQRIPPPLGNPVPLETHDWSRRINRSNTGWARERSMDTYIETWRVASDDENLWPIDKPYDPKSYDDYLKWYWQTDVLLCHEFVPQPGQSYTVPDNGYSSDAAVSFYLARIALYEVENPALLLSSLLADGHKLTQSELVLFCDRLLQPVLRWKNFQYATAPPKCLELPLNSTADGLGSDSGLQDDVMDEDVGGNEENNTLHNGSELQNDCHVVLGDGGFSSDKDGAAKEDRALEHGSNQPCCCEAALADVQFPADKSYAAMSPKRSFSETGTLELGIKQEASPESIACDPSIEPNVPAVCSMLLQDGGTLSEQEQLHEEVAATQGLVMVQHNRGIPQQISHFYHRRRKGNLSQASKSASGSSKPGAFGCATQNNTAPREGVSGTTADLAQPKKRRRTRSLAMI